jgi:hypothetical protein
VHLQIPAEEKRNRTEVIEVTATADRVGACYTPGLPDPRGVEVLQKTTLLSTFPAFIPSLCWQILVCLVS